MLIRAAAAFLLVAVSASAEDGGGLRAPSPLTVGAGDQLLGELSPDGGLLYFASNAEASSDVYVQSIGDGRRKRLFDEGADATWPRVSPDGTHLLYISFSTQATGQLCVRDLPEGEGRRCLESVTGAIQAEWIDDRRIVVVGRPSIAGDFRAVEVSVGKELSAKPLLDVDLTSPAVSPDGQWLVYVPVDRELRELGPGFAAHWAHHLEAVQLGSTPGPRKILQVDLPGETAQPAFSRDGRYLYFTQFLVDTNHDGTVDAADHGVLFRVPFDQVGQAWAQQLTDSSWNCQYPQPAQDRLVATCTKSDDLDVYWMPLDGAIPSEWDMDRLRLELELSSRRVERALIYRHLLAMEAPAHVKRLRMVRLFGVHLSLHEFDAARFYAKKIHQFQDPETAGLSRRLEGLVDHREREVALEKGREVAGYEAEERKRLATLAPQAGDSPGAIALGHVLASEIQESLGDLAAARRELESAQLDAKTPHSVVEMFYEQADALYRELDDRDSLVQACRKVCGLASLKPDAQLPYAMALTRALTRGLTDDEADAALAREQRSSPHDSEVGFALELARTVLTIRDDKALAARDVLLGLYGKQTRDDRRRELMLLAVQRATEQEADRVVEGLVQRYVDDVPPGTSERRRAESLYRDTLIGRAARRRRSGHAPQAQADYDAVVKHTDSLEALEASADIRLKAGEHPEAIAADFQAMDLKPKLLHFAQAYLIARKLEDLDGAAHAAAANEGIALLRDHWKELQNDRMARSVFGAFRHQLFVDTGSLTEAERAATHYEVALKLAEGEPRETALILGQLGALHTGVGNYRIGLSYLDERAKLPATDGKSGLSWRLARARDLLHVGREAEAATVADDVLAVVDRTPRLAEFHPLVIDRAALYNLAAGRFPRALALYDAALAPAGALGGRNSLVAHLGRAASALGAEQPERALADLKLVNAALEQPETAAEVRWPHATPAQALSTYRLIAAGLEANAMMRLGRLAEAGKALERRRNLFEARLKDDDRDEDLRAVALAEARLADNASQARDPAAAARWISQSIAHADQLAKRTGTPLAVEQADALWLAAELDALAGAKVEPAGADRLGQTLDAMSAAKDPRWRNYERWLEICLALTR